MISYRLVGIVVCLLWPHLATAQTELTDAERQVRYFDMDSGLAAKLENRMVGNYLEIVDAQLQQIRDVKKDYAEKAKDVRASEGQTAEQKLKQLQQLRAEQDKALEKILLPHQVKRLEGFAIFLVINQEGFANSMVNGFIAKHLELNISQRRAVQDEAEKALEEYQQAVIKAQKKAIARLQKALPEGKRKQFDKMLEPMLYEDGSFWKPSKFMLEIGAGRVASFPRLPSVKKAK